jgi:8-oxo-dGTP pyrophosphatase MutT (NUDIX family)
MKHILNISFLTTFLLIFATLQVVNAGGNPAGVVLYAETAQGVVLLLADHTPPSKRGWGAFGGAHEQGESIAETAARETEEETRGYFKRETILAAIKTQQPVMDGSFALYFVKVDPVPISDISNAPIPPDKKTYAERGPYAWIPAAEVERIVSLKDTKTPAQINAEFLPANRHTDYLWPVWIHNMRIAFKEKAIPWKDVKR